MSSIPSVTGTGGAAVGGWSTNNSTVVVGGTLGTPLDRLIFATQGSGYNLGTTPDERNAGTITRAVKGLPVWVPIVGGLGVLVVGGLFLWRTSKK